MNNMLKNKMSLEELFHLANKVKDEGNLVFIKLDGERENDKITVIISYINDESKEQIRCNGNDLNKCLLKAIKLYFLDNQNEL